MIGSTQDSQRTEVVLMLCRVDMGPQTLKCILVESSKLRVEVGNGLDCVVFADTHYEIKKSRPRKMLVFKYHLVR